MGVVVPRWQKLGKSLDELGFFAKKAMKTETSCSFMTVMEKLSIEQSAEFLGLNVAEVMALVKSGLLPYQDCRYYQEIQCKEKCLIFNKSDLIKIKSRRTKWET